LREDGGCRHCLDRGCFACVMCSSDVRARGAGSWLSVWLF
jgi:hypothetical protein